MKPIIVTGVLLLAASCDSKQEVNLNEATDRPSSAALNPAEAAFAEKLPTMRVESVYYIDPYPDPVAVAGKLPAPGFLDRYRIISSAKLSDSHPSSDKLKSSLSTIMHSSLDGALGCFDPHHAIRLRSGDQRFDLVMCFECASYQIYGEDGEFVAGDSFDVDEQSTWDSAFAAAGLEWVREFRKGQ